MAGRIVEQAAQMFIGNSGGLGQIAQRYGAARCFVDHLSHPFNSTSDRRGPGAIEVGRLYAVFFEENADQRFDEPTVGAGGLSVHTCNPWPSASRAVSSALRLPPARWSVWSVPTHR